MKYNRKKPLLLFITVTIGIIGGVLWIHDEWNAFINLNERVPGRDTVAFWNTIEEKFQYQITVSYSYNTSDSKYYLTFYAYDSPIAGTSCFSEIDHIHFYANTTDCIFLITESGLNFCVHKKTGEISHVLFYDIVPSVDEQVCFVNLHSKLMHYSVSYD